MDAPNASERTTFDFYIFGTPSVVPRGASLVINFIPYSVFEHGNVDIDTKQAPRRFYIKNRNMKIAKGFQRLSTCRMKFDRQFFYRLQVVITSAS